MKKLIEKTQRDSIFGEIGYRICLMK